MSETPVPIPSGSVPTGTPAWSSADAVQWLQTRPAGWVRPMWSVLALLVTVGWAIAVEPEPPCSDAVPCGTDWGGMVQIGLAVGLLYWLTRLPELTLIAAPALAGIVAWVELPSADSMSRAANVAVIAALAFGWTAARERLATRSRQRRLTERAAGMGHPLPGPVGPLRRGTLPLAAALVLCTVAAGGVLLGLRGIHGDEQRAARAVRTTAKVISHGEESVQLRTDDARRITVDSYYPEDYGVGGTVTVLEDGSWRRLVAEPYDAIGWQLLVLATALPGLSLLTVGVLARRRAAALRRAPVPALRVLERTDHEGRTWVYAADDSSGRTPLFACFFAAALPDGDGSASRIDFDDNDEEEEDPVVDTRLHEAVMLGAPYDGGELLLVTTDRDGHPIVIRTAGRLRFARTGKDPLLDPHALKAARSDIAGPRHQDRADRIAATLAPTSHPLRWGPGSVARTAGLAFTAGVAAGIAYFTRSLVTDGFGWEILPLLGLLIWINLAAVLLNWRVTADSTGLRLTGAWTVRHVPWEQLRAARYTDEGSVEIRLSDGSTWHLTGLGEPRLERRLRVRPSYVRMVEEVTTLHLHPELRPTDRCSPRDHGLPLGPVLLFLVALTTAAALFV
ncbi:hypothetical protein [Streptomyces doebereineriae]|uniref:PH domain-containing protein n=1 Tax=Streptomyces doebereineriae TaxID=3075528 RepID=A0ABU2UZ71_9ACTN|nr:hypothetical protein [Streptomyces sp. DSM 41640]MDT0478608.1 hypothetical protein [Streptomyces sp. DSM 41640]